jgi:2-dehydro-3-deoxygalactonokinase
MVPSMFRIRRALCGSSRRRPARAEPNVMRGEETKLAGVSHRLEGAASVVCMPGTHAKWVEAGNAAIRRFDTFLTGELFAVLSRHSLLARTLGADEHRVDPENEAFRRAVRQALTDGGLVGRLFSIRAASLLAASARKMPPPPCRACSSAPRSFPPAAVL